MADSQTPETPHSISVDLQTCPVCGKTFIPRPNGKPQIYCSTKCKRRAEYLRKKGEAIAPPKRKAKKAHRKGARKRPKSSPLSPEKFEDMMDPPGTYEDMLRLSLRTLKTAMTDASPKDLPALSKQLLSVSRQLEEYDDPDDLLEDDTEVEDDDTEFAQEAI